MSRASQGSDQMFTSVPLPIRHATPSLSSSTHPESYAKGSYDFDNLEQIEEFVVFMGAYEITYVLKVTQFQWVD